MKIEIKIEKVERCECGGIILPAILSHTDKAQCVRCSREFDCDDPPPRNQCDGCRRGLPLKDGNHYGPDGDYDMIGCTANQYGG